MAWLTPDDVSLPIDVWDANGMVIRRAIVGFDPQTGEVESQVLTTDGHYIEEPLGELKKRRESYPAPLTYRTISRADVQVSKSLLWDLKGK